jgi:hypothetical protein
MAHHGLSDERRARQGEMIRRWKPWATSTGPRTAAGKARSSRNAAKPNSVRRQLLDFVAEIKAAAREMKEAEAACRRSSRRKS